MRKCPIPGCFTPVPDHKLMCWPHWGRVPRAIADRVYEEWNKKRRGQASEHLRAVAEAIRAVLEWQKKEAARNV